MKRTLPFILMFIALRLQAQYQLDWVNVPHVENGREFFPDDAVTDDAGNFYVRTYDYIAQPTGSSKVHLVKISANGQESWRLFLGTGYVPQVNTNKFMLYRGGYVYTVTLENDSVKLYRVDTLGSASIIFRGFMGNNASVANYELSISVAANNHIYIACQSHSYFHPNNVFEVDVNDQYVKKVSLPNTLSWCNHDFTQADASGNVYCTYLKNVQGTNLLDVHLVKFAPNGSIAWDTLFNASSSTCSLLQVDSAGNFYAFDSVSLHKFDTDRQLLWSYNTNGNYPTFLKVFNNGDVFVLLQGPFANWYRLIHLNSNGIEVFNKPAPNWINFNSLLFHVNEKYETILADFSSLPLYSVYGVSKKELLRIFKYDTTGTLKLSYADTLFLPVGAGGYDLSRIALDKNENLLLAYKFINPQARYIPVSDPLIQQMKYGMWFVAKYCKGCRHSMLGNVALDTLANCLNDTLEPPVPGIMLKLNPTGSYAFTNSKGNYRFSESAFGNYSIQVLPPDYLQTSCDSQLNFSLSSASPTAENDFVLTPSPVCQGVLSIGASRARPGFQQNISLHYANVSSPVWQGDVALTLANGISYISAIPPADSVSGNTYFWHYGNLNLFETGEIKVVAGVQLPLNATYTHTAYLTNGCIQGTTLLTDTLTDIVTGSYDPNDKIVYPLMVREHNAFTSPFQELTYQINFQNTGTDTAFRVVVRDTISTLLDFETFTMLTASHDYEMNITGSRGIEWVFKNILLPDSNTNEPLSHGFIKYSIKPKQGIQLGDVVLNQAAIYFDFNEPIFTNEVVTEYKRWLSIEEEKEDTRYRIYPNPNSGSFVLWRSMAEDAVVSITNIEGKVIKQQQLLLPEKETELDISDLQAGIYFLHITNGKSAATKKLVKF
ncbi:MAG: T9SS type A sorting domain-containing protein [Chitinophagales bacterium]|nr:T9SS type A sorting domain-containing protein [Chitinophagales bacterium]